MADSYEKNTYQRVVLQILATATVKKWAFASR